MIVIRDNETRWVSSDLYFDMTKRDGSVAVYILIWRNGTGSSLDRLYWINVWFPWLIAEPWNVTWPHGTGWSSTNGTIRDGMGWDHVPVPGRSRGPVYGKALFCFADRLKQGVRTQRFWPLRGLSSSTKVSNLLNPQQPWGLFSAFFSRQKERLARQFFRWYYCSRFVEPRFEKNQLRFHMLHPT